MSDAGFLVDVGRAAHSLSQHEMCLICALPHILIHAAFWACAPLPTPRVFIMGWDGIFASFLPLCWLLLGALPGKCDHRPLAF